tara:strand:- start:2806 stop:3249 length:444 start_codon:yes stop_codon:yes gene_type:complete
MLLADNTSPVFLPPAWAAPASLCFDEEKTLKALRTGAGVSWGDQHSRPQCGGSVAFYRNGYRSSLVPKWLPALAGMVAELETGINVADIGYGHGNAGRAVCPRQGGAKPGYRGQNVLFSIYNHLLCPCDARGRKAPCLEHKRVKHGS